MQIACIRGFTVSNPRQTVRGICQVLEIGMSSGMSAAISGMAGIGYMLLGISLILVLVQIKRSAVSAAEVRG